MSMKMHERREDIDYDDSIRRRGTPLRKAHCTVAVFFVLALLMNSGGLYRNAQLMRFGPMRNLCVSIMKPIAENPLVSWMSLPREKLEDMVY